MKKTGYLSVTGLLQVIIYVYTYIVDFLGCLFLISAGPKGHKSSIPSPNLHTGLQPVPETCFLSVSKVLHNEEWAACVSVGNTNAHISNSSGRTVIGNLCFNS